MTERSTHQEVEPGLKEGPKAALFIFHRSGELSLRENPDTGGNVLVVKREGEVLVRRDPDTGVIEPLTASLLPNGNSDIDHVNMAMLGCEFHPSPPTALSSESGANGQLAGVMIITTRTPLLEASASTPFQFEGVERKTVGDLAIGMHQYPDNYSPAFQQSFSKFLHAKDFVD